MFPCFLRSSLSELRHMTRQQTFQLKYTVAGTRYIRRSNNERTVVSSSSSFVGLRISGSKDGSEPLLRLAHAQLEEHLTGIKIQAWTNYVKAREMSFAYNEEVAFETAEAALHRLARAPTPDRSSSFATASILRTKVEIIYPIYNPKYVLKYHTVLYLTFIVLYVYSYILVHHMYVQTKSKSTEGNVTPTMRHHC